MTLRSSALALLAAAIHEPARWWGPVSRLARPCWTDDELVLLDRVAQAHRAGRLTLPVVLDALPVHDPQVAAQLSAPPSTDAAQGSLELLRDLHRTALLRGAPARMQDALRATADQGPGPMLSALRAVVDDLAEQTATGAAAGAIHVGDLATQWAGADTTPPPRLRSPWPSLDEEVSGFRPGELVLLGAATAGGKSLAALQLADYWADHEQAPVLYAGLEMSNGETFERLLSRRTGIAADRLAARAYSAEESVSVTREARLLASRRPPLHFSDRPMTARGACDLAREHAARHGLRAMVVDYLQLVQPDRASQSRERDVSAIAYALKSIAQELGIVVLAPVQVNRSHTARADTRPTLHDLRESGALEQAANRVLLLHRPSRYDPSADARVIEVIVAKQRSGRDGAIVSLRWDPERSQISDHRWSRHDD